MTPVILVDGVSKRYPSRRRDYTPLLWGGQPMYSENSVMALERISFAVAPGEIVGIVGRNGAGKSTLLRILAGISKPSAGHCDVVGRVSTLLDLSAGLQTHKSGRENVIRRLEFLGASRAEAEEKVAAIVDFAELRDRIDEPMASYSTGMRMRLAFAIATAIEPDILLIDEALAVGDEFFSARSFRRIQELTAAGSAAVIVSHDWTRIFRLATRVIWLDRGRVHRDGRARDILYPMLREINAFKISGEIEIVEVSILDRNGAPCRLFSTGDTIRVRVSFRKKSPSSRFAVIAGVSVSDNGESIYSIYSPDDAVVYEVSGMSDGHFEYEYPDIRLTAGDYDLVLMLTAPEQGAFPTEHIAVWGPLLGDDCRFRVAGSPLRPEHPLVELSPKWSVAAP
jgi:lipopolysaccharide transport system ATP-binding protein